MRLEGILQELKQSLYVYWQATGIGLLLLDENGETLESYGSPDAYCDLIHQNQDQLERCRKVHAFMGPEAEKTGSCFFYGCHGNMMHFSIALLEDGKYAGSVVAGPVMADYPSMDSLDEVIRSCEVPPGCRSLFLSAMQNIQVIEPERMYYLGELLAHLVNHLMSGEDVRIMRRYRDKRRQQELIGEALHDLKTRNALEQDERRRSEVMRSIQVRQEQELAEMIERGSLQEAQDILNDILGGIYFSSGSTELIKLRINELLTVLCRELVQKGADAKKIWSLVADFQKKSAQTEDAGEISFMLSQVLPQLVGMLQGEYAAGIHESVRRSLEYIHRNYRSEITLNRTAAYAMASPAHLSRLFNADMGMGFSSYVNHLRVKKAKELLKETELSLSDISQAVGFSSQQYFSRIFKEETGVSPGQYRHS